MNRDGWVTLLKGGLLVAGIWGVATIAANTSDTVKEVRSFIGDDDDDATEDSKDRKRQLQKRR